MSKLVLEGSLLKKVNKGGFKRQAHEKIYMTGSAGIGGGRKPSRIGTQTTTQNVLGASYYVFICPACEKRNKRPEKASSYANEGTIAFLCNGCERTIEIPKQKAEVKRIVIP